MEKVKFNGGPYGVCYTPELGRFFSDEIVVGENETISEGVLIGPHPELPDWHVVEVVSPEPDKDGERVFYAPVHASHYELLG